MTRALPELSPFCGARTNVVRLWLRRRIRAFFGRHQQGEHLCRKSVSASNYSLIVNSTERLEAHSDERFNQRFGTVRRL